MVAVTDEQVVRLHKGLIVIDVHVDTVLRWVDLKHDLGSAADPGYMDLDRMRQGNLSAAFFACCVEYEDVKRGAGRQRLETLLAGLREWCERHSDRIGLARSAQEIRDLVAAGKFAAIACIEGGQGIGDDVGALQGFWDVGVRYISLCHFLTNDWADSSTDVSRHDGLSGLGRAAVAEANRLGMMIDVSHATDKAVWDILKTSSKPVVASHSSARALVNHPRNLSDELIAAIAQGGGLIGITWWPEYISNQFLADLKATAVQVQSEQAALGKRQQHPSSSVTATLLTALVDDQYVPTGSTTPEKYSVLMRSHLTFPTLSDVLDHIDHVVKIAGDEHVCIGSDHGAVNYEIQGLEDCTKLPALTRGLLERGYAERAVRNIMGENVLNLMQAVMGR